MRPPCPPDKLSKDAQTGKVRQLKQPKSRGLIFARAGRLMPAAIILASVNFATPAISSVKVPHSLNSTAIQNEDPGDTSLEEDGSGNGEAAN